MVPVEVAIERLRHPKPGGKIWAAREYGVDLTLLMASLKRSPGERLADLQSVMRDLEHLRSAVRKRS